MLNKTHMLEKQDKRVFCSDNQSAIGKKEKYDKSN